MTRPNTYRATQADWDLQKTWSDDCQDARCLLELRARVEALEVDANEDSASTHFCFDSIFKRLEALEAGATCPHIISSDEGTSYCRLAEQTANSQPTPNDRQSRSSLVERVGRAISLDAWDDAGNWTAEARAAIRAVAEWMREHHADGDPVAATVLEREARR